MDKTRAAFARMQAQIRPHRPLVTMMLHGVLGQLGVGWKHRKEVMDQLWVILSSEIDEDQAAQRVNTLLHPYKDALERALAKRTDIVWQQIRLHLVGSGKLLDFGCGDGGVAHKVVECGHQEVSLYDVADYRAENVRRLPFMTDLEAVRANGPYGIVMVLTVLHHCNDANSMIKFLSEVAQKVVLIESVASELIPWPVQFCADWIYNRGMHPDAQIPVPGDFRSAPQWTSAFEDQGFSLFRFVELGFEQDIVPEPHTLSVFENLNSF